MYKESIRLESYDSTLPYGELRTTRAFDLIIKDNHSDNYSVITNDTIKQDLKNYFRFEDYFKSATSNINSYKVEHLRPMFS